MAQTLVTVSPWMWEERAEIEAFIDLARSILHTGAKERLKCPQGHEDHGAMWFEPNARFFVPPSFN